MVILNKWLLSNDWQPVSLRPSSDQANVSRRVCVCEADDGRALDGDI